MIQNLSIRCRDIRIFLQKLPKNFKSVKWKCTYSSYESWVGLGCLWKFYMVMLRVFLIEMLYKSLVRKVTNVTNYNSQQCMELLLLVPTNNNLRLKCVVSGLFPGCVGPIGRIRRNPGYRFNPISLKLRKLLEWYQSQVKWRERAFWKFLALNYRLQIWI